jgi:adenylate cyclase
MNRSSSEPGRSGKNRMNMEIERKFLIDASLLPRDLKERSSSLIVQGYLTDEAEAEIRVRKKDRDCFLTIKKGTGLVREEREIRLTKSNFNKLWPLTKAMRVEKRRYIVPAGIHVIELDVYQGKLKGLVTAEVEFPSMESCLDFQPPAWFGPDISKNEGYKNRSLAVRGLPPKGV